MKIVNRRNLAALSVVLSVFAFGASPTWGAKAVVRAGQIKLVPAGGGATLDLLAFSEAGGVANAGAGSNVPGVPGAVLPADEICVSGFFGICFDIFGFDIIGEAFAPPFGFRGAGKPAVFGSVLSVTGPAEGVASFDPVPAPGKLRAQAVVEKDAVGEAAAEAVDPLLLPPGDYEYGFFIDEILLEVTEELDVFAGVGLFATDSRFPKPLWSFGVAAEGSLGSKSDLMIDFVSNTVLGLTDTLIEQSVLDGFAVADGVATLSSFELFDTIYPVDEEILFSTGGNAGVRTSVPEPATITLFGLGLAGLWLARRRSKWLPMFNRKSNTQVRPTESQQYWMNQQRRCLRLVICRRRRTPPPASSHRPTVAFRP